MATAADFDVELTTSLLMAQLGLDDIGELHGLAAEAAFDDDDDEISNEDYALRIQAQYLQNMLQIIEDHRLAMTFDEGLEADYPGFQNVNPGTNPPAPNNIRANAFPITEDDELEDEYLDPVVQYMDGPNSPLLLSPAPSLGGSEDPPHSPALSYVGSDEDDLLDIYVPQEPTVVTIAYEVAREDIVKPVRQISCIICNDQFTEDSALLAPCDHHYCEDCLVNFVTASTRDESVFPPKCCDRRIPSNSIIPFLSPEAQMLFLQKDREYSIPIPDRIYCPTADCSAFLGSSEYIRGEVTCSKCNARVCVLCKQVAHSGDTCSENTVTQEVRALARTRGWQTCPDCNAIIELHQGCFHITCRCHAQFCYLCAAPWKQCSCPQWEENRL